MSAQFLHYAALAFFASAYADQADEAGQPMHGEILDQLPAEIDPAAADAARTLLIDIERMNGATVSALLERIGESQGDRPATIEMFAHYCAMQAMGHGVGLADAFGREARELVRVPYVEFSCFSLERDYF